MTVIQRIKIGLIATGIAVATMSVACVTQGAPQGDGMKAHIVARDKMFAKLHLTTSQKAKVKVWEAQMKSEMQSLQKRGGSEDEMNELMDKHVKRFQRLLTPAQKKIYDREMDAMRKGG